MAQLRWTIDGRHFTSLEEYEAGLRDKEIIDELIGNLSLGKPKDIEEIYQRLQNGKFRFETIVGRQFDDNIYELYCQIRREQEVKAAQKEQIKNLLHLDFKKRRETSGKIPKAQKGVNELDDEMKRQVARELHKRIIKRWLIGLGCGLVAITCFAYVCVYSKAAAISRQEFEELAQLKEESKQKVQPETQKVVIHRTETGEIIVPDILPEYQLLYEKNNDLAGWIKIDDTNIDYPVVQTKDNEFYLNHDFNKNSDKNGCIFLDTSCDILTQSDNYILYGHHMRSGNMFGNLNKYKSFDYYEKHPYIQFDTIYERGKYQVMYVFQSKVFAEDKIAFKYYQFINATSAKEFDSYMYEMSQLSLYDTGVSASYGDKLLTLSTCDYQENKGRFVVVAKKCD